VEFEKFSQVNAERARQWHPGGLNEWSIADWAVAMAGEAGEVCNVVKKYNRVRDSLQSNNPKPFDWQQLADEIGDTFCYLDLLATRCGMTLEECVRTKFNKISEREGLPQRV
jgi:NTP pyrophosphatase (non-canonical NTP hydrolase)